MLNVPERRGIFRCGPAVFVARDVLTMFFYTRNPGTNTAPIAKEP